MASKFKMAPIFFKCYFNEFYANPHPKRHLEYLLHFETSPKTNTDGISGVFGQHFSVCRLVNYVALAGKVDFITKN
jgi:hypothetical protein